MTCLLPHLKTKRLQSNPFGGQLLPFLKKKQDSANTGLIIQTRAPDEPAESEEDNSSAGIESCAHALINAVHAKDAKAAAMAIKDAFDILESGESEEDAYSSKHDYDSQNIKAAGEQE